MADPISAPAAMAAGNMVAGGFQIGGGLLQAHGQKVQMQEAAHQTRRRASWSSFQLRQQAAGAPLAALSQEVQAEQVESQARRRGLDAEQARIQAERLRAAAELGQAAANVTDQGYSEQLRATLANLDASRAVAGVGAMPGSTGDALRSRISSDSGDRRQIDVGNRRRAARRLGTDAMLTEAGAGLLDADAGAIRGQAGSIRAGAQAVRASARTYEILADLGLSDAERSVAALNLAGRSMMMSSMIRLIPRAISMFQSAAPGLSPGGGGGGWGSFSGDYGWDGSGG